jgi:hypothetical protein
VTSHRSTPRKSPISSRRLCGTARLPIQTSAPETGYFGIFVEHAVRYGEVYATVDPGTGRPSSDPVFPVISLPPPSANYDGRMKDVAGPAFDRVRELDGA